MLIYPCQSFPGFCEKSNSHAKLHKKTPEKSCYFIVFNICVCRQCIKIFTSRRRWRVGWGKTNAILTQNRIMLFFIRYTYTKQNHVIFYPPIVATCSGKAVLTETRCCVQNLKVNVQHSFLLQIVIRGCKGPFAFGDNDTEFLCCQKGVPLWPVFLFTHVDKKKWQKTHRCRQVRTDPNIQDLLLFGIILAKNCMKIKNINQGEGNVSHVTPPPTPTPMDWPMLHELQGSIPVGCLLPVNRFQHVSSDDHQMSIAGRSPDPYRSPGLMSRGKVS